MLRFLVAQEVFGSGYLLILATPTRHSKGAPVCRYTGVTRKVSFKLRPKDRKGAPLCRYTRVTRKVPFKFRPKDRKKVSDGY